VPLGWGSDNDARDGWIGQNLDKSAHRDGVGLGEARSSILIDIADRGERP